MTKNADALSLLESLNGGWGNGIEPQLLHLLIEVLHVTRNSFVVRLTEVGDLYVNHSTKSTAFLNPSCYGFA